MDSVFKAICESNNDHRRTIIHLDMDYFYAQIEEIRDPSLRLQPLGIQQKNIVVTCNYIARQLGVKKLMLSADAKRLCSDLVLINGEDLTPYRQMSRKIYEQLLKYTPHVEKLGFDENFLDVTTLVEKQLKEFTGCIDVPPIQGNIYPSNNSELLRCNCGCDRRLLLGSKIAQEIRRDLFINLGITCSAGISYNKLLAKLVGAQNKPNQQTVLISKYVKQFLQNLGDLDRITGIGAKTASILIENNIKSILELQCCDINTLRRLFGYETAIKLKSLAFGCDKSIVKYNGKPKTISLEDSCKPISLYNGIEYRFKILLLRLMEQVAEDGRIPVCIKIIVRKYNSLKRSSHRETKQANIVPSLFKTTICPNSGKTKVVLIDNEYEKLLTIIMRLFERVVDLNQPFNITLIGLSFSKFQERKVGCSSIANFLIKKTDLEVQSITSLTNINVNSYTEINLKSIQLMNAHWADEVSNTLPTNLPPSGQIFNSHAHAVSPIPTLDNGFESGNTLPDSNPPVEPLTKKPKIMTQEKHCVINSRSANDVSSEIASPSKLRVCDLRLNSRDSEREACLNLCSHNANNFSSILVNKLQNIDTTFSSISHRQARNMYTTHSHLSTPNNSVWNTFNDTLGDDNITSIDYIASEKFPSHTCPPSVDLKILKQLPNDLQNELVASWRNSLAAVISKSTTTNVFETAKYSTLEQNLSLNPTNAVLNNRAPKNTLYHYFLSNK